jgi:hypothetical protein
MFRPLVPVLLFCPWCPSSIVKQSTCHQYVIDRNQRLELGITREMCRWLAGFATAAAVVSHFHDKARYLMFKLLIRQR